MTLARGYPVQKGILKNLGFMIRWTPRTQDKYFPRFFGWISRNLMMNGGVMPGIGDFE